MARARRVPEVQAKHKPDSEKVGRRKKEAPRNGDSEGSTPLSTDSHRCPRVPASNMGYALWACQLLCPPPAATGRTHHAVPWHGVGSGNIETSISPSPRPLPPPRADGQGSLHFSTWTGLCEGLTSTNTCVELPALGGTTTAMSWSERPQGTCTLLAPVGRPLPRAEGGRDQRVGSGWPGPCPVQV